MHSQPYSRVRQRLVLAVALALAGCGGLVPQTRSGVVSSVGDIRNLPAPLTATVDVKLTGTVTFFNTALDQAWIQDATGGVRVDRIGLDPLVHVGDVVELTGRATMGGSAPIVLRESLRILSTGAPPPPPVTITAADVEAGRHQYLFVEAAGIVRSASMDSRGRLALMLRTDGEDLSVGVREVGRADPAQYLDAGVTMQGVLVTNHDAYGRTGRSRLLVSSTREITISRPAPTAATIPLLTVQALVNGGAPRSAHRVRLRGVVSAAGDGFRLTDATGAVALAPAGKATLAVGDDIEVAGFPADRDGSIALEQAMRLEDDATIPITHRVLTQASEIRGMSVAEAKRGYPVKLRGVITYYNPHNTNLNIQDASAGIYVRVGNSPVPPLQTGQLIELEGFTGPGDVVPVITAPRIKVIGTAADAGADGHRPGAAVRRRRRLPVAGGRRASSTPSSGATRAPTSACGCTSSASRWRFPASRRCPRGCSTRASGPRASARRASTSAGRSWASRCVCPAWTSCTSSKRRANPRCRRSPSCSSSRRRRAATSRRR